MERLSYRQRRKRQAQAACLTEAYFSREAEDPGLRATYRRLPRAPIRLIVSPMGKFINQGGILRIAEAFRLECVDYAREADDFTDLSGATGIWDWQPYRWIPVDQAIAEARSRGYAIYGLSLSESAISIERATWTFPCAIVLGEEQAGLSKEILDLCDACYAIPLFGILGSLNVASACTIAAHEAVHALRAQTEFEPARALSRQLLAKRP